MRQCRRSHALFWGSTLPKKLSLLNVDGGDASKRAVHPIMKTHTQSKSVLAAVLVLFSVLQSAVAGPPSLAGTYHETGKTARVTITDLGGGRYEIKASRWTGYGFWDEKEQCYEGIYRYPTASEDVGHQRIVRVSKNVLAVSFRPSMIGEAGGTYQLEKVKAEHPEIRKP